MATKQAEILRDDDEVIETELIPAGVALSAADRAAIDVQIATAKLYSRNIRGSLDEAMVLATMDEDTAASMFYVLPRGGKKIEGPSARLAEVLAYVWGNDRAEARVVAVDDTHVTAQGTFMDLEKNYAVRFEVRRRITDKHGKRYDDDMITVTGNAAASIAFRNAVFKGIPAALIKRIYEQAKAVARGAGKPIETRRQAQLAWFANIGRQEGEVLRILGVEKVEDIGEDQIESLVGLRSAIRDGTITIEAAFANENGQTEKTATLNEKLKAAQDAKNTASPDQHKAYMAAMTKALNEGGYAKKDQDAARHLWQKEHIGKESTSDWSRDDYSKALHMLETGIKP